jgi:hypothetical protein
MKKLCGCPASIPLLEIVVYTLNGAIYCGFAGLLIPSRA